MKADYDAKVEAIREAHRVQIAEETRQLHSKLSADLQEAQAQAAEEFTKLLRAKAANFKEMEAIRLAREQPNNELRRYAEMDEVPRATDNDETPMDDFTKTLALSCQKDRKNKYKYACGLMTKQTLTHPRK